MPVKRRLAKKIAKKLGLPFAPKISGRVRPPKGRRVELRRLKPGLRVTGSGMFTRKSSGVQAVGSRHVPQKKPTPKPQSPKAKRHTRFDRNAVRRRRRLAGWR